MTKNKTAKTITLLILSISFLLSILTFGSLGSKNTPTKPPLGDAFFEDITHNTYEEITYIDKTTYHVKIYTNSENGRWWQLAFKNRSESEGIPYEGFDLFPHTSEDGEGEEVVAYNYDFDVNVNDSQDTKGLGVDTNGFYDIEFYFTDSQKYVMTNTHYFPLIMSDSSESGENNISEISTIKSLYVTETEKNSNKSESITVNATQTYKNASTDDVIPQKIDLLDRDGNIISTSTNTINKAGENKLIFNNLKSGSEYNDVSLALNGYDSKINFGSFSFKTSGLPTSKVILLSVLVPSLIIIIIVISLLSWWWFSNKGNNDSGYSKNKEFIMNTRKNF